MAVTFPELQAQHVLTFEDVRAALQEYAEGGRAVVSRVVIELIWQIRPNFHQKAILLRHATIGLQWHTQKRHRREAQHYQEVCNYLRNPFRY